MASFISAGHHLKDSGAVGSGTQENLETIKFRNLVVPICKGFGMNVITDDDNETLAQYLQRIKTGSGSVVLEFHFDAANNPSASGATCLVGNDADRLDKAFAKELVDATSSTLKIRNRGVIDESMSHRGRLGLMREQGIVALLELCFISNAEDMKRYNENKLFLATQIARIVYRYENMIQ
jgi:N-acetylmuramoyl-L-alanine amidase